MQSKKSPLQSKRSARPAQQGFILVFILLISAAIVTAAATVTLVTQVDARSSTANVKNVEAFALAYAGLQRAMVELKRQGSGAVDSFNALASSSPQTIGGLYFNKFNAATVDLRGNASNSNALGKGSFRLFLVDDVIENDGDPNTDSNGTLLIRSFGWIGDNEVLVEGTFRLPLLYLMPSALAACVGGGGKVKVKVKGRGGPGWPFFNWRLDGFDRPSMTLSKGAYAVDGFTMNFKATPPTPFNNKYLYDAEISPTSSHNKAGPYHLTEEGVGGIAADDTKPGIDQGYGMGTPATPSLGWGSRPFGLKTVPDALHSYTDGNDYTTGSFSGGSATAIGDITQYRIPIIGFKKTSSAREKSEVDFAGTYSNKDPKPAYEGYYGCQADANGDGDTNQYYSVGRCLSSNDQLNTTDNPWGWSGSNKIADSTRKAGLAWNVLQTVLRKCEGSGDSATCCTGAGACLGDYRFLQNIAQCLILPNNVQRKTHTPYPGAHNMGDTGGVNANYRDGKADDDASAPDSTNKSWYPGGYPMYKVDPAIADAWILPSSGGKKRIRILAKQGLCQTGDNDSNPTDGAPGGSVYVKYCDPSTGLDGNGVSCLSVNAWKETACHSGADSSVQPSVYFSNPGPDGDYGDICDSAGTELCYNDSTAVTGAAKVADNDWGDFTRCSDSCVFEYDDTAQSRTTDPGANNHWRSACINLDPYHIHRYGSASVSNTSTNTNIIPPPTQSNGERGSIHFIARLDLTDSGPMGACVDGTLNTAVDLTYPTGDGDTLDKEDILDLGTCRTGGRNNLTANNLLSENAIANNRPDFEIPISRHPRSLWPALFSHPTPGHDPWLPATTPEAGFCDDPASTNKIYRAIEQLLLHPDVSITSSDLPSYPVPSFGLDHTEAPTITTTYGGAVCQYDSYLDATNNYNGWYVADCGDPQVVTVTDPDFKLENKIACGCGLLVIRAHSLQNDAGTLDLAGAEAEVKMKLKGNSAVVWRGMVVFMTSANGAKENEIKIELEPSGGSIHTYLYVDGSILSVSTGTAIKESEFEMEFEMPMADSNNVLQGQINTYIRLNHYAVSETLQRLTVPNKAFRIVY